MPEEVGAGLAEREPGQPRELGGAAVLPAAPTDGRIDVSEDLFLF